MVSLFYLKNTTKKIHFILILFWNFFY